MRETSVKAAKMGIARKGSYGDSGVTIVMGNRTLYVTIQRDRDS
jgi:hypothetical protein